MRLITALLFAATLGAVDAARAQTWPQKPVRLIVPTGPGAATDLMARVMAAAASQSIGGAIYVDDIPGASGIPAHQTAARAEPDGYTFLFSNTSGLAINPVSFKQLAYDPTKDFTPVAVVADLAPQAVSVNKDFPARTLPELIAYAKAHEGLNYAVDATSGAAVFSGRLLNQRAGMKMAEVSYRSAGQMTQDVAAGHLPVLVSSIPPAQPFVDSGALRQIAVFSGRRFPALPDLPSVAETVPGAAVDGFFVVVAPVGVPAAIVERMNKAIADFLKTSDAKQKLTAMGLASSGSRTPAEAAAFVVGEQKRWRDLAKELPIEPQ